MPILIWIMVPLRDRDGRRHGHRPARCSIDVMRLDLTLGQSRHFACASSCMSMMTSLEEGIKLHKFAGIFPEQFFTEAGRHREAVVAADQRMVIRCFRDDLAGSSTMFFMCRLLSKALCPAFMMSPEWKTARRRLQPS